MHKFQRVQYPELTAKQKEVFNFQKAAGVLADYGFNCIKLADDWQGADFLAYHKDGNHTLKVQLKGRLTIDQKYAGKGLHVAFPLAGGWCFVGHDELVKLVGKTTNWLLTESWVAKGQYHSGKPSKTLVEALRPFILTSSLPVTIGELFREEPTQWGLRGDPFLWRAMRTHFSSTPLPIFPEELEGLVHGAFKELTGEPLTTASVIYVSAYDQGGMSSGHVSPEFWREFAIPCLVEKCTALLLK